MSEHPYIQRTVEGLRKHLVGQKIVSIGYLSKEECEEIGWDETCLYITLENGVSLFPSQDDEGNGPGAVFTTIEDDALGTIGTVML